MMAFLKKSLRNFVGFSAWLRLTEFRQEFKVRKVSVHMDSAVYEILNGKLPKTGFYLDIGAHDGRTSSNTFHLEKMGWNGILVEPMLPKYFKMLEYRNSSNTFVNAACVSPEYQSESLRMIYCDLMSFAPEISSVDQDDWKNGSKQFMRSNEEQLSVFVPVTTVDSLLSKLTAPSYIDFLSIDVEGAELSVLEGLDLSVSEFGLVCIETNSEVDVIGKFEPFGYSKIGFVNGNLILVNKNL
jgi:FkbM family methyltransferase